MNMPVLLYGNRATIGDFNPTAGLAYAVREDEADVLLSQDIHFPFFFRSGLNHEARQQYGFLTYSSPTWRCSIRPSKSSRSD